MTAKHTPGPWFQGCGDDPKSGDIYMSDSSLIAEAFINGDIETMLANARLIAAAPDLLEALRCVVNDWVAPDGLPFEDGEMPALDSARAAIAKATGSQS